MTAGADERVEQRLAKHRPYTGATDLPWCVSCQQHWPCEASVLLAQLATITAERDRVRAMLTPALAEVAAYRFAGPCTEAEFAEAKAVLAERDALRLVVDQECPVGALDLVTSLRAEAQLHREQVAALEAERDAARAALRKFCVQSNGTRRVNCLACTGSWWDDEPEDHDDECLAALPTTEAPYA